jgi:hypothetical protein
MTRTAHATLITTQKQTAYSPSITITTTDNGLPHPATALAYPMTGFSGNPTTSVVTCARQFTGTNQGSFIRAHRTAGVGLQTQRITDPTTTTQWTTGWTTVDADGLYPALFTDANNTIILTYQTATYAINYRTSTNDGQSWSAATTITTPAFFLSNKQIATTTGLFYANDTYVYFRPWNPTTNSFGSEQSHDMGATVTSIGATYDPTAETTRLALILEDYADWTDSALVLTTFDGTTWGDNHVYLGLQGGDGASPAYSFSHVHLSTWGTAFLLTFRIDSNPTYGGLFTTGDHIIAYSNDGTYFTAGIKLGITQLADRLQPLLSGGTTYLAADTILLTSTPTTTFTATEGDVTAYHCRHHGPTAYATVTLDNRDGTFDNIHSLRLGADLTISRGATVNGTDYQAALDTFVVDKVLRSKDGNLVTIGGYNYYRLLNLWHADLTYYFTNQPLGTLVEIIAALAGIHTTTNDSSSVFNTTIGAFAIQPGQSAAQALAALMDQFQFVVRMNGAALHALTLSSSPTSVYTFGKGANEHPTLFPQDTASRLLPTVTHAQVIGTGTAAEKIAADLQSETGRQFTHRVEKTYITATADATAAATAMINKVETSISRSTIISLPAFHLQPFDPIDSDDYTTSTVRYIAGIEETYNPTSQDTLARRGRAWQMTLHLADYTKTASGGGDVNLIVPEALRLTSVRKGKLISFDTATYKGLVRIAGSASAIEIRAGEWIPPDIMDEGSSVAVLLYDESNPDDGLILGPYGGLGWIGRSKLYASDGDPVALQANSSGNLTASGSLTLGTGAAVGEFSTDGNMADNSDLAVPTERAVKEYVDRQHDYFERLFGADKPTHSVAFTSNQLLTDSGSNQLGFPTNTAAGDTYTPSGNFSKSNSSAHRFYVNDSILVMSSGGGTIKLIWMDNSYTAQDYVFMMIQMAPRFVVAYGGEIRLFDTVSPTGTSKYWALRWAVDTTTYPDWPFRLRVYYGTGTTYSISDGTKAADVPYDPTKFYNLALRLSDGARFDAKLADTHGRPMEIGGQIVTGYPTVIKRWDLYVATNFQAAYLDWTYRGW